VEVKDLISKSYSDLEFDVFRRKLAGYAKSESGKSLALESEVVFARDRIEIALDETEEAVRFLETRPDFPGIEFEKAGDIGILLKKAHIGDILLKDDLKILREFLEVCVSVDDFAKKIKPDKEPRLCDILYPWESLGLLFGRVRSIFTPEGIVRDGASPELKKLRGKISTQERIAKKSVDSLVAKYQKEYGEDVHLSLRHNRFLVALPRGVQSEVSGMVVDLSGGGAQVLIEPEPIIELNNQRVRLVVEEEIEVRRILLDFSREVSVYEREIEANSEILAMLDFIFARARLSRDLEASRPNLYDKSFDLIGARHPLISGFIPEDISLEEQYRGIIVSGVNAGGKTVLLKLIGLCTLMAYIGCFIPARPGSSVPLVGGVFADIGDDQSIAQHLSTFTSHLHFLKGLDNWLFGADPETNLPYCSAPALVLMDEIGGGTEPTEGAALAYGVIAYLIKQPAIPILTTHYDLLKGMPYKYENIKNISLEFDESALKPTFRVIDHQPGKSFALDIAKSFGVNRMIVKSARSVMTTKDKVMADVIKQLDELRIEAEKKAVAIRELEAENISLRDELKARKEEFVRESKKFKAEIEKRLDEMVADAKKRIKRRVRRKKDAPDVKLVTDAHEIAKEVKETLSSEVDDVYEELDIERFIVDSTDRPLAIGDTVLMTEMKTMGRVLDVDEAKGRATIDVNGMRVSTKLKELSIIDRKEYDLARKLKDRAKGYKVDEVIKSTATPVISQTLDLHGMTVEESREEIEPFIDAAIRAGFKEVRIMHGIGTGALKRFVGEFLRKHSHISHVRSATVAEGGVGVTIAVIGKKGEMLGE